MAVCGLPVAVPDHAERMVRMAIRMVHITREHALEHYVSLKLRVGINSGPVVAGVIGKSKYIYDLWGDIVNLASRMESGGIPDGVQVTRSVYEKVKDEFAFEARGAIEMKGKGSVEAWLLRLQVGSSPFAAVDFSPAGSRHDRATILVAPVAEPRPTTLESKRPPSCSSAGDHSATAVSPHYLTTCSVVTRYGRCAGL